MLFERRIYVLRGVRCFAWNKDTLVRMYERSSARLSGAKSGQALSRALVRHQTGCRRCGHVSRIDEPLRAAAVSKTDLSFMRTDIAVRLGCWVGAWDPRVVLA